MILSRFCVLTFDRFHVVPIPCARGLGVDALFVRVREQAAAGLMMADGLMIRCVRNLPLRFHVRSSLIHQLIPSCYRVSRSGRDHGIGDLGNSPGRTCVSAVLSDLGVSEYQD